MKFRDYITEERMNSKDRRTVLMLVDKPQKTTFVLKSFETNYSESEREVDVYKNNGGVSFEYNTDHYELTNFLVDIADKKGLEFKVGTEKGINITTFTIML